MTYANRLITWAGNYKDGNRLIDWQRGMERRSLNLIRGCDRVLTEGEELASLPDHDWLGLRIGVTSQRPEALLRKIHKDFFPTFDFTGIQTDGARHWTHFRLI